MSRSFTIFGSQMLILGLTVSVKPKKVLEWKYFIYLPSLVRKQQQMAAMSKCPDYVWRKIEP